MPRAFAAARSIPSASRATALSRPSDHGSATSPRGPRRAARRPRPADPRLDLHVPGPRLARVERATGSAWCGRPARRSPPAGSARSARATRRNCSDHWSCWSPPGVPNAITASPSRSASDGVSVVRGRLPGASAFGQPPLEPEHLRPGAETEAQAGDRRRARAASRRWGSPRPCCPSRSTTSTWQVSPAGRPRGRASARPTPSRGHRPRDVRERAAAAARGRPASPAAARATPPRRPARGARRRTRAQQRLQRHVGEPRVAVPRLAIGERQLGALDHRVDVARPDRWPMAARSKPRSSASCCSSTGPWLHGPALRRCSPP